MGETGSVTWQFTRTAYFSFPSEGLDFDEIFELALDCEANDITEDDGVIEIYAPVDCFKIISDKLDAKNIVPDEAELRMIPNQEIELDLDPTLKVMRLIEQLEDLDDTQNVYSNLLLTEAALEAFETD